MKTKKDVITWIIIFILIGLFLWQLPNFYNFSVYTKENKTEKKEKVTEQIPATYNCSLIDNTTSENGYKTFQELQFTFTKDGNLKETDAVIEYTFTDKNLYNKEKNKKIELNGIQSSVEINDSTSTKKIQLKIDHSTYTSNTEDDIVLNIINGFPTNYSELKKYLSNHLYSCYKK